MQIQLDLDNIEKLLNSMVQLDVVNTCTLLREVDLILLLV